MGQGLLIFIISDVPFSWKPSLITWVRLGASLWLPRVASCFLPSNFAHLRPAEACLHWTLGAWYKWPGGEWARERGCGSHGLVESKINGAWVPPESMRVLERIQQLA